MRCDGMVFSLPPFSRPWCHCLSDPRILLWRARETELKGNAAGRSGKGFRGRLEAALCVHRLLCVPP